MVKWPVDAPKARVIRALGLLGGHVIRGKEPIALIRTNPDGSKTPLTMPNHPFIKGVTLRVMCTQAGISREDFLGAFPRS